MVHKSFVSAAAFTNARKKLKHTAFIELNQRAVVETMYAHDYETLHGLRVLAVDGSKIILPDTKEMRDTFGTVTIKNAQIEGTYTCALASVLYDVLNRVAIDARFSKGNVYEVAEAEEHLAHVRTGDLVVFDRGYSSYRMMASMAETKAHFLIRCHENSFAVVNEMLKGAGMDDVTVTLSPSAPCRRKYGDRPYPASLSVRFVRVPLATGECEVLATSLTDTKQYPLSLFKDVYWKRWGIETFYGTLKTRLCLENFSGLSTESVRQDFYAAVLLTGLESILTDDVDDTLAQKETVHIQKVNKAVSFNTIKHRAFDLFMSDQPPDAVIAELAALFTKTPTMYRKDRNPERKKRSSGMVLNFWKRKRKCVF